MSDPDERAAWIKSIHESMGSVAPDVNPGDGESEIARIATPDAVTEVRDFLLALASVMPPRTSLRHAVAYMIVAAATMRGCTVNISELIKSGGLDEKKMPLFDRSFMRSIRTLKDTKLIDIEPSDDDRRASHLQLTTKGYELLDKALRPLR